MNSLHRIIAVCLSTMASAAIAIPNHLALPSIYDNVGNGHIFGQTFVAEASIVSGVRWYIGDPTRPSDITVNALEGVAYLVMFDAANPSSPIELARTQVQAAGGVTFGLTSFSFSANVPTTVGGQYFIALEAADQFGMGLRDQSASTYAAGSEAYIWEPGVSPIVGGLRDTSFEVVTTPVPEPGRLLLTFAGLSGVLASVVRNKAASRRRRDA